MVRLNDWREYERQKFLVENDKVGIRTFSGDTRFTAFGEAVNSWRTSKFNYKPTWGLSTLRDTTIETGVGAAVVEENGEFKLSTGTETSSEVALRTKERGQYQAGAEGEAGIGIRMPTDVTGTQYWEWGYFDDNNGFGYGIDSTGVYVFRLTGGTQTKVYQSNWNKDVMDGTSSVDNPSGHTLDLAEGNIFQINFVWYGYGAIKFYINIRNNEEGRDERLIAHTITAEEEASIIDPNQPLTIQGFNGASTTTNSNLYVGGRQFSIVNGDSQPNTRNTPIEKGAFSVTSTSYTPFASIRKKANLNGRENSVNCFIKDIQVTTDQPILVMITYGGVSTGGTWGTPVDVIASETAMEVNATITGTSSAGTAVDKVFASGNQNKTQAIERSERIAFGAEDEAIIWIKKTGSNASVRLIIDVDEEW